MSTHHIFSWWKRGAALLLCALCVMSTPGRAQNAPPSSAAYRSLADETAQSLQRDVLSQWFPRAVNGTRGGFDQNFAEDWSRASGDERSIVYQARLTWLASQAALRFPQDAARYRECSVHGLRFLESRMWDAADGGFFWELDDAGAPLRNGEKHAYGMAFGIYAACAAYRATGDRRALQLAQRAFLWLDKHAHDGRNGGYFEALRRDGTPILQVPAPPVEPNDFIGTRYGFKSMNTHIHLLEAFAELVRVWPQSGLARRRAREVFFLVRDRITVPEVGVMNLYFTPSWRAVPDVDSYGHDIETAYLLMEAAHVLKLDDAATQRTVRKLVDHTLEFGFDNENGGFYDAGGTFSPPLKDEKIWWVQAEGLNALLWMHRLYGRQTSRYWKAFEKQWNFIRAHQIDAENGGWRASVSKSGEAVAGRNKSDRWTEGYHQGRALLNVSKMLQDMAGSRP